MIWIWRWPSWALTVGDTADSYVFEQTVVLTTLRGDYAGFGAAAMRLGEAMAIEGLAEAGPMFSRYLVGPAQSQDPADFVTEICIPI